MIYKLYSVRDNAVGAYLPPMLMRSRGEATRAVTEALRDPQHQFSKHSQDFVLFELGEWDDNSGAYCLHDAPFSLGVLVEFKEVA